MQKPKCKLCRGAIGKGEFSRDHIIPRRFGGSDADWNIQPAHRRCNSRRGIGYLPAQIPMVLEAGFVFDDGRVFTRPLNKGDRTFLEAHFQRVNSLIASYRQQRPNVTPKRGGARAGAGRKRKHGDNATRQRVYRGRRK